MPINAEIDAKISEMKAYIENFGKEAIAYTVQSSILAIRNRATKGEDLEGKAFKPYSTRHMQITSPITGKKAYYERGYAQFKQETNTGWLMVTGAMLTGIKYMNNGKEGKVYPLSDAIEQKIIDNENLGRSFFGINESESDIIFNRIIDKMKAGMYAIFSR